MKRNNALIAGIIVGMSKKSEDPGLRALPPTAIGSGIGGLIALLNNLGDEKFGEKFLRNLLIGGGLGFGSSLIFPEFGK